MDLGERGWAELGGAEGGETVVEIHCMREEPIFHKKIQINKNSKIQDI